MLRDGGPADRETARQFAYRKRPVEQLSEYTPPGCVSECIELQFLVRFHLR
jgi:hypothetical protein